MSEGLWPNKDVYKVGQQSQEPEELQLQPFELQQLHSSVSEHWYMKRVSNSIHRARLNELIVRTEQSSHGSPLFTKTSLTISLLVCCLKMIMSEKVIVLWEMSTHHFCYCEYISWRIDIGEKDRGKSPRNGGNWTSYTFSRLISHQFVSPTWSVLTGRNHFRRRSGVGQMMVCMMACGIPSWSMLYITHAKVVHRRLAPLLPYHACHGTA